MTPKPLLYVLALVGSAGAGFWLGKSQLDSASSTATAELQEATPKDGPSEEGKLIHDAATSNEDEAGQLHSLVDTTLMEESALKRYRVSKLFEDMTLESSEEMFDYIKSNFSGAQQRRMLARYYTRMGELDGLNTFEEVLKSDNRYRISQLSAIARGWAREDPTGAWAAMMEISNNGASRYVNLRSPLREIALKDPALAVRMVQEIEDRNSMLGNLSTIVGAAADKNTYKAVLEESLKVEDDGVRNQMLNRLFTRWGEDDFEEPSLVLATFTDSEQTDKAMRGLLTGWARVDGRGAFEYALSNRDNPLVGNSLVDVAKEWTRRSTASEMEDFVTNLPEGQNWDKLTSEVSYDLARVNPRLALDMSIGIQDDQTKARAVSGAMWAWTQNDIEGAESYFETLSEGKHKTWARYSLALGNIEQQSDVGAAIGYIKEISDESEQADMLSYISDQLARNRRGIYRQEDITAFVEQLNASSDFDETAKLGALSRLKKQ